ncbi:MAG TPA: hypothetical protein VFX61_00210 [Micromonosporaceae bacterium]|nr:hypothetical protein [Micromonosporaceae bacterium]
MYAWIWRRLPFGLPGKLIGSLLLITGAVALLWFVVFPWAEPYLPPYDDVQVGTPDGDVPGGGPGTGDDLGDGSQPGDGHDLPYDIDEDG